MWSLILLLLFKLEDTVWLHHLWLLPHLLERRIRRVKSRSLSSVRCLLGFLLPGLYLRLLREALALLLLLCLQLDVLLARGAGLLWLLVLMMMIKRSCILMSQLIIDEEGPLISAFPRRLLERGPESLTQAQGEKGRALWLELLNRF